jgi:hypothetical protein
VTDVDRCRSAGAKAATARAVLLRREAAPRRPRAEDLEVAEARAYADELAGKWTLWRSVVARLTSISGSRSRLGRRSR